MPETSPLNLPALRQRLAALHGPAFWRSLEEAAGTEEFRISLEREFPQAAGALDDGATRRDFLRLMGASLALAGVTGCEKSPPREEIVPYVNPPEAVIPGRPLYFATAMPWAGYARGVLAESHEGRPTKIEGNPQHPASLGAADVFTQASVLELYDPDRAQVVTHAGNVDTWGGFATELRDRLDAAAAEGGAGLRILTGAVTSPTLAAQIQDFLEQFPRARWHRHEPAGRANTLAGLRQAFGRPLNPVYQLDRATLIVSLDSDFLFDDPGSLRYARQFADGRRVQPGRYEMNRLYAIESTLTITGSMADHRLAVKPSEVEAAARHLLDRISTGSGPTPSDSSGANQAWLDALARDLRSRPPGSTLIIAGESQPTGVHVLAHAINAALGNVGKSLVLTEPVEAGPSEGDDSLRALAADMESGQANLLLILGGNPVYTAPADIGFESILRSFSEQRTAGNQFRNLTAHLSLYDNETTFVCRWGLPQSHYLESWGDLRGFDGTASVLQPLISPLYETRTAWEVMQMATGLPRPPAPGAPASHQPNRGGYEIVRAHWGTVWNLQPGAAGFERRWQQAVQKGVIDGTAAPLVSAALAAAPATAPVPPAVAAGFEIAFRPDSTVWDGSFANNGWLQELPKQLSKLTWDNAALISPRTAERLGAGKDGAVLSLTLEGRSIEAAAFVLAGLPDDVVTLHLGYGRWRGGRTATDDRGGRGFNAYRLRTSASPGFASGLQVALTGREYPLAATRSHNAMDTLQGIRRMPPALKPDAIEAPGVSRDDVELSNRRLIRTCSIGEFKANNRVIQELGGEEDHRARNTPLSLYPGWDYSRGYQWGMSIDLNSCIGCNACVTACQAENNIAVVGKDQVSREREMHWIRIDSYFGGPLEHPEVYHQPVPCMHCENAPCELVCPVGATTHSVEGLNEMTYNRCVGTRYCSNNCPYKVRRFNFYNYMADGAPSFDLQHNPEVTVRIRGVMEKCTYCVQRITRSRIDAQKAVVAMEEQARHADSEDERRELARQAREAEANIIGQLQTACQQSCPTQAIVFGNKNNPKTNVARLKASPLDYGLLEELTTRPRTTYMGRLRNPNEEIDRVREQGGAA